MIEDHVNLIFGGVAGAFVFFFIIFAIFLYFNPKLVKIRREAKRTARIKNPIPMSLHPILAEEIGEPINKYYGRLNWS